MSSSLRLAHPPKELQPGLVVATCNPSTWGGEVGIEMVSLRLTWATVKAYEKEGRNGSRERERMRNWVCGLAPVSLAQEKLR